MLYMQEMDTIMMDTVSEWNSHEEEDLVVLEEVEAGEIEDAALEAPQHVDHNLEF